MHIRDQVIERLWRFNARHGALVWDRRWSDPIAAHGLAFFYVQVASPKPLRYELRTATRLFLAGPEAETLPATLFEMIKRAKVNRGAEHWDPRTHMANRFEPMQANAVYVGLGVSTLDTHKGAWSSVVNTVTSPLNIGGIGYVVMDDGTRIRMDRRGEDEFLALNLLCNRGLDVVAGSGRRNWQMDDYLGEAGPEMTLWTLTAELHQVISDFYRVRPF